VPIVIGDGDGMGRKGEREKRVKRRKGEKEKRRRGELYWGIKNEIQNWNFCD
jgi:hypothetical protein